MVRRRRDVGNWPGCQISGRNPPQGRPCGGSRRRSAVPAAAAFGVTRAAIAAIAPPVATAALAAAAFAARPAVAARGLVVGRLRNQRLATEAELAGALIDLDQLHHHLITFL